MSEASRHFDEKSAVFAALQRITRRLKELDVPYAIVGGMALFKHGLRRFTEDVDILVRKADLKRIHLALEGLGYIAPRKHSKTLRDTENGVRIEFLTTGEFPGDGKPKPVAFPDPDTVSVESNSIKYISLPRLVELKLASGMTGAGRLKDLGDVEELIKLLNLPPQFAQELNPYVRDKFTELWKHAKRRYVTVWPNRRLATDARLLEGMQRDGVILEREESAARDHTRLVTTDPDVAAKYEMVEESEFWQQPDDERGPGSPSQ